MRVASPLLEVALAVPTWWVLSKSTWPLAFPLKRSQSSSFVTSSPRQSADSPVSALRYSCGTTELPQLHVPTQGRFYSK